MCHTVEGTATRLSLIRIRSICDSRMSTYSATNIDQMKKIMVQVGITVVETLLLTADIELNSIPTSLSPRVSFPHAIVATASRLRP
jgi:hypothetical protein